MPPPASPPPACPTVFSLGTRIDWMESPSQLENVKLDPTVARPAHGWAKPVRVNPSEIVGCCLDQRGTNRPAWVVSKLSGDNGFVDRG